MIWWLLVAGYFAGIIPSGVIAHRLMPDDLPGATLLGFFWPVVLVAGPIAWTVRQVARTIARLSQADRG